MLNLGSLFLGITAWVVPFIAIKYPRKCFNLIIFSFSSCIAALCLQLFEINHRVQIEDWSALMDTTSTLIWIGAALATITILLSIMTVVICKKRPTKI